MRACAHGRWAELCARGLKKPPKNRILDPLASECHKSARAKAAALPVIMPIIGPRETHDYRKFNV